jgi:hypothetical protein
VHGSKDRAKDASSKHSQRSLVWMLSAYAYDAHADDVPLLGVLRTSVVIGAPACRGGYLCPHANQPRPSFQRRPAKGVTFQKIGMSFTVTTYEGVFLLRV